MNQSQGAYGVSKNNMQLRNKLPNAQIGLQGHQRSTSTQDNYPGYAPELVKTGMGNQVNSNMRRSMDNYT